MSIDRSALFQSLALAKLEYDDSKEEEMLKEMQKIIDFVESLDKVDVSDLQPTYNSNALPTVLREDKPVKSDVPEQLLENAPDRKDNFIQVPLLVDRQGGKA